MLRLLSYIPTSNKWILLIFGGLFLPLWSCSAEKYQSQKSDDDKQELPYLIDHPVQSDTLQWKLENKREIRGRIVRINPTIFKKDNLSKGRKLLLNLFDDLILVAKIDSVRDGYSGTKSYTGPILSFGKSNFSMVIKGRRLLLNLESQAEKKAYRVFHSQKIQHHVVVEMDIENFDPIEGDSVLYPDSLRQQ